eukprot:14965526-Alexandrium_andersonii.AAC.1
MSASLVGSEMCIRDSYNRPSCEGRLRRARRPIPSVASASARQMANKHTPVSYTHLTLPTICSV